VLILNRQANIYEHEGSLGQAYLLLFRHADLVLRNIAVHPDAKKPGNKPQLLAAEKEVHINLKRLEALKPKIKEQHDRYVKAVRERDVRRAATKAKGSSYREESTDRTSKRPLRSDPALANGTRALEVGDHKELAVKLAQREIHRRATARKATRQAGISQDEEHDRRAGGVWGEWETDFSRDISAGEVDDVSRHLQAARSQVEPRGTRLNSQPADVDGPNLARPLNYRYPSIRPNSHQRDWSPPRAGPVPPPKPALEPSHPFTPGPAPSLPLKEDLYSNGNSHPQELSPPPRPEKVMISTTPPPKGSSTLHEPQPTSQNDLQSSSYTFKPAAYLENGSPLRTIMLPSALRDQFLSIALPNTKRNLETCGVLCGTLVSNALFVSKLVIPEQESTSDTCETVNESALFDYCDSEDLMVLGWIHTHPTQTCFMSSRDLHTHCGYQVMMPESIAIVCAPSKGE
jgi:STAM-binding protein